MTIEDYIVALRAGCGFEWIAKFGDCLSRDDLIRIIKELDYAIDDSCEWNEAMEIYYNAASELEDYYTM